mgnify:CR=1 FL=1
MSRPSLSKTKKVERERGADRKSYAGLLQAGFKVQ